MRKLAGEELKADRNAFVDAKARFEAEGGPAYCNTSPRLKRRMLPYRLGQASPQILT